MYLIQFQLKQKRFLQSDDTIEEAFIITGQTLDTKEAVVTNVLIQKPMTVYAEGISFEDEGSIEEEDTINPAFAKLKDLL